ncbi:MAG: hypothetical protein IJU44_04160 [Kiritimatiellae bacterium]|nr:hypothetical protein [Kiritimatiellia bacterium]
MKCTLKTLALSLLTALSLNVSAGETELSYAIEDAAFQTVTRLSADQRLKELKNIAFVRLSAPNGAAALKLESNVSQVYESALVSVPCDLRFVVHSSHDPEWTLIDEVFDQAADFDSYNPATNPKLKQLKLADALLYGQAVDAKEAKDGSRTTIRISMRLIKVATAEMLWGGVIEGSYDDVGPDNEQLNLFGRKAIEAAARDAVAKLPANLDGYGVFLLPFDGPAGRAMTQTFLNELVAAGRHEKIRVYDLPNGGVADRMLARFLRERAGAETGLNESLLKKVEAKAVGKTAEGKMAILTGMVTSVRVFPETAVDPTGQPVNRLTGSFTAARPNATRFEVVADLKIRDINDKFRVVAAVGAHGTYEREIGNDISDQLRSFVTVRNCVVALLIVLLVWFVSRFMLRVR